jgi:cytochrome o ubiquinol oxidase operon protein cyoD
MDRAQHNGGEAGAGSYTSSAAGFIISVALTAAAFGLAASGISREAVLLGVSGAALVQIAVHLRCFLHPAASPTARWNVMALIFAVIIMALFVGGTIWTMYKLYYHMH